jgi:hypothetical protein
MSHTAMNMKRKQDNKWQIVKETEANIAPGVKLISQHVAKSDLMELVYMVELDTANELLSLEPVSSGGKTIRLETVGNLLNELELQGKKCVAGFNGDFFSYVGVPSGLQLVNGEIITSPDLIKVLVAVMQDGSVVLEDSVKMMGELRCVNGFILPIDMVNRPFTLKHTDHACVYTWRYGDSTDTPEGGVEVIISSDGYPVTLIQGQPIKGTVTCIKEGTGSAIEHGNWVLSLTGSKAREFQEKVALGEHVSLHIAYDKGIENAIQVISGNSYLAFVLLKDGKVPDNLVDPTKRLFIDRHPRTVIATKEGKLYIAAIDGRQPDHSDGMSLAEEAYYLQSLGMENAINLDGGGSTTCYIRQPGDEKATLINRPSDGFEREVGNALAIISKAPTDELASLVLTPAKACALAGCRISFQAKGHDRYWNAIPVQSERIQWSIHGQIGAIDETGVWTAGLTAASGQVNARYDEIVQSVRVSVTDHIARLVITPAVAVIAPGDIQSFQIRAYDDQDEEVMVSNEQFAWYAEKGLGRVEKIGNLHTATEICEGMLTVSWGTIQTNAKVFVGKKHLTIADFEKLDKLGVSEVNAIPGSVSLNRAPRPLPVRFGTFSGEFIYDFTGKRGNSEAHVTILNDAGESGREIEGKPYRFGMWVCADKNRHWLGVGIQDADGSKSYLSFTDGAGIYWRGWRYVFANVPSTTKFPIRVHTLSLMESDDTNKTRGVLYLDTFRAEYQDFHEDVEGPTISCMSPGADEIITTARPIIRVKVTDSSSGVDPSSIRVWLNETVISHSFNKTTGLVEYIPESDLKSGVYCVVVEASDKKRNAATHNVTWSIANIIESCLPPEQD